jgi:multicomponent Na+:H+ antiporter subunit G
MPDVFNRIQAGTKASTLGTLLILLGIGFIHPGWWGRLLIIAVFILITVPVSNHVIARAAYHHHQEKGRFFRDDLGSPVEKEKEESR